MEVKRYLGNGRYSAVVQLGQTLYLAGLTSDESGMAAQTKDILAQLESLLEQHGSDKRHILRATIYITDMQYFAEMNEVWDAWVEKGFEPARACVTANMARDDILIEVVVDAAVK